MSAPPKPRLTAEEHREIARALRRTATAHHNPAERQRIMLSAIEHEAVAEELERLEGE
jgi:cysteine sulfinate desulfinase/cysteine desulfurase-like protein